jgi:tetratricopeptide (TPR) repeat protein
MVKLRCVDVSLVLSVLAPAAAQAQSITVLSSGGDARSCSISAEASLHGFVARNDLDACNRALDQVTLVGHDRAATLVNRGILQAALQRYDEALDDYNDALEIEALPQAWNGKGNLYFLASRYDDAIAAYERSLELELPEPHVGYFNVGLTYEKRGDAALAEQHYRRALELKPDWQMASDKLERLLRPD